MVDAVLLPPSLQDERGLAFLQMGGSASAIDLAQTQIDWIDQAPAAALPALALQSGMLNDPGWILAATDAQRRALLNEAFTLSSLRGTPWAIKRALSLSGWPGITLQEGLSPKLLDGSWILDGAVGLDQLNSWARFRAIQPLPATPVPLSAGHGAGLSTRSLGDTGGDETSSALIEHTHPLNPTDGNSLMAVPSGGDRGGNMGNGGAYSMHYQSIGSAGSGDSFSLMPPFLVLSYVIKT